MNLKEKIDQTIWVCSSREVVEELEQITDDFAIGFTIWLNKNKKDHKGLLIEELLEIYKKTL